MKTKTTTKPSARTAREMSLALVPQVNAYLLARTVAEARRDEVDATKRRLLAEGHYFTSAKWAPRMPVKRILSPDGDWLMDDEQAKGYYAALDAAHKAAGYDLEPGHCPALVAEHVQTQAEWALIEAAQKWFPEVTNDRLLCGTKTTGGVETRQQYIDLLVKLVVNAPGYVAPKFPKVA
jgi:hypothetical protein